MSWTEMTSWTRRLCLLPLCGLLLVGACSDDSSTPLDAGADGLTSDGPTSDGPTSDGPTSDGPTSDGPAADSGPACPTFEPLSDDIVSDTTLDGCYLIDRAISVSQDATLTIAPGSVLMFKNQTGLSVSSDGALAAVGTADQPILLTGEQQTRGFWRGVALHNSSAPDNALEHVIIEYGGSYNWPYGEPANLALTSSGSPVHASIASCTLRESAGYGFFLASEASVPSFVNNTVTANASGAGYVEDDATGQLDDSTTYAGNDKDFVWLDAGSLSRDQTWPALDVPYVVDGMVTVDKAPGIRLTIAAGARFELRLGAGISVGTDGALIARGTAAAPIIMTWSQVNSHWRGVAFHNSASGDNALEHVTIEHAGSYNWSYGEPANVALTSSGNPVRASISNCVLQGSAGYGFFLAEESTVPSFANNTITANASGAGYVEGDAAGQLDDSTTYAGNDADLVWLRARDLTVTQTWPAIDVPYHVDGNITVNAASGILLTIAAGATLAFRPSAGISVGSDGRLTAVGTSTSPITFTWAVPNTPWRGLQFHNSNWADNKLDHVVVEHGGGYNWSYADKANIALSSSGSPVQLTLTNSTISDSAAYGVWVDKLATFTESGNTYSGNVLTNVYYEP